MSRNLIAAIAVLILIVVAGGFFYSRNKSATQSQSTTQATITPTSQPSNAPSTSPSTNASPSGSVMQQNTVTLTSNGFEPQTLTIKTGEKVTWKNMSGTVATVNSDPHPVHTLWPFLNLGNFQNGETLSVTFDKAGTYTYHNHFEASEKGTVVVK